MHAFQQSFEFPDYCFRPCAYPNIGNTRHELATCLKSKFMFEQIIKF